MPRILLGRYELGDLIGSGGVASVHCATDLELHRRVAVKVLSDQAALSGDPSGRQRFLNEARSVARLSHPNLVTVFDAGEDAGVLFLVMEYVDGESLAQMISARAPMPAAEAVSIALQILDGLSAVHASGVIHRDVKPANVMVDNDGQVRITDFGIAKSFEDIEDSLTATGTVIGTPAYLAPEQSAGGQLDPRTDIYLVGLVLYEMLTGVRASSPPAVVGTTLLDPRHLRPDVSDAVAEVVIRATQRDPAARFESARAMSLALGENPAPTALMVMTDDALEPDRRTAIMPVGVAASVHPTTLLPTEMTHSSGRQRWWLLGLVAASVVLALIVVGRDDGGNSDLLDPVPSTVRSTTVTVAPTTEIPQSVPPIDVANDTQPPETTADQKPGKGNKPEKPEKPAKRAQDED